MRSTRTWWDWICRTSDWMTKINKTKNALIWKRNNEPKKHEKVSQTISNQLWQKSWLTWLEFIQKPVKKQTFMVRRVGGCWHCLSVLQIEIDVLNWIAWSKEMIFSCSGHIRKTNKESHLIDGQLVSMFFSQNPQKNASMQTCAHIHLKSDQSRNV